MQAKKQIASKTKTALAYTTIHKMIIAGEFSEDRAWSLRSLSTHLEMSMSPVLGALRRLEQQGLIVIHPQRGITRRYLDRHQIAEAYILREALETQAARIIAADHNMEAVKKLEHSAKLIKQLYAKQDIKAYSYEDFLFHRYLVEAAHCGMLLGAYEDIATLCMINEGGWYNADVKKIPLQGESDHLELVRAIRSFDPDTAEKAVRRHISNILGVIKRV